jgi:hypothetical protein
MVNMAVLSHATGGHVSAMRPLEARNELVPAVLVAVEKAPAMSADAFIERVREIAREHGYALAVHGSLQRDLDLIAAPWTPEAVSAQHLVDEICDRIPLHARPVNLYDDDHLEPNPEMKPWGRLAWSLAGCPAPWKYVDLSVAPRAGEAVPAFIGAAYRDVGRRWDEASSRGQNV